MKCRESLGGRDVSELELLEHAGLSSIFHIFRPFCGQLTHSCAVSCRDVAGG